MLHEYSASFLVSSNITSHLHASLLSVITRATGHTSDHTQTHKARRGQWKDAFRNIGNRTSAQDLLRSALSFHMPQWAHYLFISPRHQLSPELHCVSHRERRKKKKGWELGCWPRWHSVEPVDQNLGTHILLLHFLFLAHKSCTH